MLYDSRLPGQTGAEKSKRAAAAALKLEEERRAEDIARIAKGKQHQAVHMNHKQAAKEVRTQRL